jgi:hypothetical protein
LRWFARDQRCSFPRRSSHALARSPEVYARIREWFGAAAEGRVVPATSHPMNVDAQPMPMGKTGLHRSFERVDGYRALLQDAIDLGSTAIQKVQEDFTARPFRVLEMTLPIKEPTGIVRSPLCRGSRHLRRDMAG